MIGLIRILLVDDHPALRAGLTAVLRAEPGLVPTGAAASEEELWPALERNVPDVVILDYHFPDADGLVLCRRIKQAVPTPAVLVYSAYADASLGLPAMLAGADGVVSKGAPAGELFDAVRRVARGERVLPPVSRELLATAADRLDPEDLPLVSMAVDGTTPEGMAEALRLSVDEIGERLDAMIGRLKVEVPV